MTATVHFGTDPITTRQQLAACYRLFDFMGWTEAIFNHITVRTGSGADARPQYLINPFGLHFTEVTATNLVQVDADGNCASAHSYAVNQAGFVIHGAIHQARSDAHCVMHVHTTAGSAVACKQSGLRHDNFYSAMLSGDVAYHDYEGVTTHMAERPRLVAALGDKNHLILRNHGLLVVGANLPQAFQRLWTLQRACEIQLASDAGMGANIAIAPEVLARVPASRLVQAPGQPSTAQLMFGALVRRAGIDPTKL